MTELLENPGRVAVVADKLRCTEGQLYSMVIALAASSALVLTSGVPLGRSPRAAAAQDLPASAPVVVPSAPPGVVVPPVTSPLAPTAVGTPGTPLAVAPPYVAPSVVDAEPEPTFESPSQQPLFSDYAVPAPGAPRALAVDATHVYTGTDNTAGASRLFVLSRTGSPGRAVTVTGQPAQHDGGLTAAAVHGGEVLVTDRSRAALVAVDPRTGRQQTVATLPDLPPCVVGVAGTCQPGAEDRAPSPEGVVVSGAYAYVADAAQGTVWRVELATRKVTAWYASSDFASGQGPSGLAVDGKGDLVLTAAETVDPAALLKGALYRLQVTPTGPGTRTLLATFAGGEAPGPVAVGSSGAVYVGLRGVGGVVAVKPDGTAVPVAGAAKAPAPGGLALVDGTLFVADAGKPATATSGRVLALPVAG